MPMDGKGSGSEVKAPSLGLTGVTMNERALPDAGRRGSSERDLGRQRHRGEDRAGTGCGFLTAVSWAQLARLYPEAGIAMF